MSDPQTLSPADTGPAAQRRALLVAHAKRAGCGVVRISNSMQELLALACIGKSVREAKAEILASRTDLPTSFPVAGDVPKQHALSGSENADNGSLLDSMLRTSGRVVSRES